MSTLHSIATQRADVIAQSIRWLGTPFHFEACVRGAGVACGPLLIAVYQAVGIPVPQAVGHFPRDWHLHTTEERYLNVVKQYAHEVEAPENGDMVLFRVFRNRPMCHGGIITDWPTIIHASDRGSVEYLDVLRSPLGKRERVFLSPWSSPE
jgi:cell wall-associated NlpC family hydrolase